MSDLKVLNFMTGLKSGYAKYLFLLYVRFQLDFDPVLADFDMDPLVQVENIAFSFLHIKPVLFQKF